MRKTPFIPRSNGPTPKPRFHIEDLWRGPAVPRDHDPGLDPFIEQLLEMAARIPFVQLNPKQCSEASALLFQRAPLFVLATAHALERQAALFPDIPFAGADLARRQRVADDWRYFAACLNVLADWARQSYLQAQGAVLRDCTDIVQHVQQEPASPFFSDYKRLHDRLIALAGAIHYLEQSPRRKNRREQARRARRERRARERAAARGEQG